MDNKKIPSIPTKNVRFESGELKFDVLSSCAYSHEFNAFVGGKFVPANLTTETGAPIWIKLDGKQLVIETLIDCLIDKNNGTFIGGKIVEVQRFNIIP